MGAQKNPNPALSVHEGQEGGACDHGWDVAGTCSVVPGRTALRWETGLPRAAVTVPCRHLLCHPVGPAPPSNRQAHLAHTAEAPPKLMLKLNGNETHTQEEMKPQGLRCGPELADNPWTPEAQHQPSRGRRCPCRRPR